MDQLIGIIFQHFAKYYLDATGEYNQNLSNIKDYKFCYLDKVFRLEKLAID